MICALRLAQLNFVARHCLNGTILFSSGSAENFLQLFKFPPTLISFCITNRTITPEELPPLSALCKFIVAVIIFLALSAEGFVKQVRKSAQKKGTHCVKVIYTMFFSFGGEKTFSATQ